MLCTSENVDGRDKPGHDDVDQLLPALGHGNQLRGVGKATMGAVAQRARVEAFPPLRVMSDGGHGADAPLPRYVEWMNRISVFAD